MVVFASCDAKEDTTDLLLTTTFYIDKTNGNDTNSGTSTSEAWKTFENVNKRILAPGTQVLLKKGETWNERLEIYGGGTADQWIKIGSYGDGTTKPKIALNNGRDDIAMLISDLFVNNGKRQAVSTSYIVVDGLEIADTRMGIYYRNVMRSSNTGFKLLNTTFTNIHCDDLLSFITIPTEEPEDNVVKDIKTGKGNLPAANDGQQGGAYEYVFPAALFIGGRIEQQTVDGAKKSVLKELEVDNCTFDDVFTGVMSWFYWPFPSGNPDALWCYIIDKIRITNCTGTGFLNGIIALDGVNGGAEIIPGSDNMMAPDQDGWGLVKNVIVPHGATNPARHLLNGTTAVILNNTQNLLIDYCEFSGMDNFGGWDGCGFDFESHDTNITLSNTKFMSNRGESLLMMNGGNYGGSSGIRICNNLFVDNVKKTTLYKYDLMFSLEVDQHQDIKFFNNTMFMNRKNEANEDILPYEYREYLTFENNKLYYLDETAPLVNGSFWGENYSYRAVETTDPYK